MLIPSCNFLPALQGSACAPLPDGNAAGCGAPTCALPIGARLYLLSKSFGKAILAGIVGASRKAGCDSNGGESRNPAKPVKKMVRASFTKHL
jgi:hypothetical protein